MKPPIERATVRLATTADAADIARLRMALLVETGALLSDQEHESLLKGNEQFYAGVSQDDMQTWLAHEHQHAHAHESSQAHSPAHGRAIAVGTLAYWRRPPYPGNPQGLDAYLLNMYTAPSHRGQGLAQAVLQAAMAAARQRGVGRLILHATAAGRPIYERAGFEGSSAYMELALSPAAR